MAAWEVFVHRPGDVTGYTVVQCFHDIHGNIRLYFSAEQFQTAFMPAIRSLWANEYTFLIQPM